MENDKRFAVLIDADNVSERYIKFILDEISNDGVTTYKRIYGDWTSPTLTSWKKVLLDYSITPIQQYSYTTGKNSTDSAMIIDAMDILYTDSVEGFCIVSSDSDFTRLASRLREAGKYVVGMGEKKTPSAFIAACNKFKYLEVLAKKIQEDPEQAEQPIVQAETTSLPVVREAVLTIVREISDDDGWAMLGEVGNTLLKRFPDFDVRNYGFSKLTPFVKSLGKFEEAAHVSCGYAKDKSRAALKSGHSVQSRRIYLFGLFIKADHRYIKIVVFFKHFHCDLSGTVYGEAVNTRAYRRKSYRFALVFSGQCDAVPVATLQQLVLAVISSPPYGARRVNDVFCG